MLIDGYRHGISCTDVPGLRTHLEVGLDDNGFIVLITPGMREYVLLNADDSMLLRKALEDAEGEGPNHWPEVRWQVL